MPERIPGVDLSYSRLSIEQKQQLYQEASQLISDNKRELFDRLAPLRTRYITVVLENIYQSHNAAAVLRSCDCFGIQDVHVVENGNVFNPAGDVAVGSSKWVDYYKYSSTKEAYSTLHKKGYNIVATLPHEKDCMIGDLDLSKPIALVFGTELTGLTQDAIEGADAYVKIPMYGFTESFNISVCAALSLFSLTERMRASEDVKWTLSENEIIDLKLQWIQQVVRDGENVINNLLGKININ